jgi:hypothetical protein
MYSRHESVEEPGDFRVWHKADLKIVLNSCPLSGGASVVQLKRCAMFANDQSGRSQHSGRTRRPEVLAP